LTEDAGAKPERVGLITGATAGIGLATAVGLARVAGRRARRSRRYFREGAEAQTSPQSHDVALRERRWSVSADLVGLAAG